MKFKIGDTHLYVTFPTVAVISVVIILDTEHRVPACFLAALIHECGHLVTMIAFSVHPYEIHLRLFDVLIKAEPPDTLKSDALITLGGPVLNLIFALIALPFYKSLSVANLCLGVFNMLPIKSFDGGHLLWVLLERRFAPSVCDRIINILTFIFLVPLMLIGILVLLYSKYNYSLLLIGMYLVAVLFLK